MLAIHAARPSGPPAEAGGPEGLDVQFLVRYAGLKPAPTAIASIASAPREYTIFLSMTFPSFPTDVRSAELSSACTGHRPRAPTWPAPLRCTAGASTLRASLASDHLLRFSSRAASTERPCPRISRWPRPLIGRYRTLGRSLVGDDGPGLVCIARTKHRGDGVVTGWATRPSPPPRR